MKTASLPATVKGLAATGPDRLEMLEQPPPILPAPGQLCVRIERTLISPGTELAKLRGLTAARQGSDWRDRPLPLGYSAAGVVVAVGSHDDPFAVGDRVSASAPHASYATIRCAQAAKLPDTVGFPEGTFGTLAALALHVVRLSQTGLGDTCGVVGFGLVGQLIALCARAAGARRVAIKEHRPLRREIAKILGFAEVSANDAFDVVFECAGTPSALSDALALAVRCGRVVAAGSLREPATLDVYRDVHAKSVSLIGAHGSSQHAPSRVNRWSEGENRAVALDFIADGRLPVNTLATATLPSSRAKDAFDLLTARTANAVVLDWTA